MKIYLRKREIRSRGNSSKPHIPYIWISITIKESGQVNNWVYLEPNEDKTYRNEKVSLAEKIKAKRLIELSNEEYGFPTKE